MLRKIILKLREAAGKLKNGCLLAFYRNLKKKELGIPQLLSSLHSVNIIGFFSKTTPCYMKKQRSGRERYFWSPPANKQYYYRNLRYKGKPHG